MLLSNSIRRLFPFDVRDFFIVCLALWVDCISLSNTHTCDQHAPLRCLFILWLRICHAIININLYFMCCPHELLDWNGVNKWKCEIRESFPCRMTGMLTVKYAQLAYYECIARIHRRCFLSLAPGIPFIDMPLVYLLWLLVFISCRFPLQYSFNSLCASACTQSANTSQNLPSLSLDFFFCRLPVNNGVHAYIICEIPQKLGKSRIYNICFIDAIDGEKEHHQRIKDRANEYDATKWVNNKRDKREKNPNNVLR